MEHDRVIEILKEAGAFLEGHFLLTSGKHSGVYLQCAQLFRDARYAEPICRSLAGQFDGFGIDVVIGPAMGAVQLAYEVGRQLGCQNFFTEREEGKLTLRRGFTIKPGMRVLVVEDVCTTGGTVREVMEVVELAGGQTVGVGVVVDRTGGNLDFGVPLKCAVSMEVLAYDATDCPICASGLPLVKPGSRKQT